jgi:hypothetical protein
MTTTYSPRERRWLWTLALVGLLGLNGIFLYAAARDPAALRAAMANPVSAAFIVEALVLTGAFAYLLAKWRVTGIHWGWFVAASLVGGLAFAVPVAILVRRKDDASRSTPAPSSASDAP